MPPKVLNTMGSSLCARQGSLASAPCLTPSVACRPLPKDRTKQAKTGGGDVSVKSRENKPVCNSSVTGRGRTDPCLIHRTHSGKAG